MAMIEAVDVILLKAREDDKLFDFVLDFVTREFEKSEYELAFTYMIENYVLADASCKNTDAEGLSGRTGELRDKVEMIKKLAVGNIAPGIRMPLDGIVGLSDSAGSLATTGRPEMRLSDIDAAYTLILFWASWCPHCPTLLSAVQEVYDEYRDKGLEVLAISIDDDRAAWLKALSKRQYRWINYSELNGWDGKAAKDYGVWSTPRMYLLDREKRIISKLASVEELKESIASLKFVKTE